MAQQKYWALTPKESIRAECARRGVTSVANGCIELIGGADTDYRFIDVLAGPAGASMLDRQSDDRNRYWLRVWGTRGLLWAWPTPADRATDAIRKALTDPHWRVREMAAKVVARHGLGDLLEAVASLRADATPRVQVAAEKAVEKLTNAGA